MSESHACEVAKRATNPRFGDRKALGVNHDFRWMFGADDDVIQEAYLRMLRMRDQVRDDCAKAYLFAVARNAAIDLFRRCLDQVSEVGPAGASAQVRFMNRWRSASTVSPTGSM